MHTWETFFSDARDVTFRIEAMKLQGSISDADGAEATFLVNRSLTFTMGRRRQGPTAGQDRIVVVRTGLGWRVRRVE